MAALPGVWTGGGAPIRLESTSAAGDHTPPIADCTSHGGRGHLGRLHRPLASRMARTSADPVWAGSTGQLRLRISGVPPLSPTAHRVAEPGTDEMPFRALPPVLGFGPPRLTQELPFQWTIQVRCSPAAVRRSPTDQMFEAPTACTEFNLRDVGSLNGVVGFHVPELRRQIAAWAILLEFAAEPTAIGTVPTA